VINIPSHLSDDELTSALKRLAAREQDVTAELEACVAELDARHVPVPEAVLEQINVDREGADPETGPEGRRLEITVGKEFVESLHRLQDLLRSEIPDGNVDAILNRALSALLERSRSSSA